MNVPPQEKKPWNPKIPWRVRNIARITIWLSKSVLLGYSEPLKILGIVLTNAILSNAMIAGSMQYTQLRDQTC